MTPFEREKAESELSDKIAEAKQPVGILNPWKILTLFATMLASFALVAAVILFIQAQNEGETREDQFCAVILDRHQDTIDELKQTDDFLASAAASGHSAFNDFIIQTSIPQAIDSAVEEEQTIPPICASRRDDDPERYDSPEEFQRVVADVRHAVTMFTNPPPGPKG